MKKTAGIALTVVGIVGLLAALPLAVFVWKMSGFLDSSEKLMRVACGLGLPLVAIALILVGHILRREEPIQPAETTRGK